MGCTGAPILLTAPLPVAKAVQLAQEVALRPGPGQRVDVVPGSDVGGALNRKNVGYAGSRILLEEGDCGW